MKLQTILTWSIAGLALTSLFSSCVKNTHTSGAEKILSQGVDPKPELAYPGLHGPILRVRLGTDSIDVEQKGGRLVWMDDIAFDQATLDSLNLHTRRDTNRVNITVNGVKKVQNTFVNNLSNFWPGGQVYYTVQAGFSTAEQTMISDAITHWQANTTLTFTQRTTQANYVVITPGALNSGLYSTSVGMTGGAQTINLESGAFITGNVIHEIGHNIGFYHEHMRTDRGSWINVYTGNVLPQTAVNNFETYAQLGESGAQIDALDFNSVMMYGSFYFSDNIHPTITTTSGATFTVQRNGLSAGDIKTAYYMYKPVYVRFSFDMTDSYGDLYSSYTAGNVTAHFYTDAAGTIPATLVYPIDVQYYTLSTGDCQSYVQTLNDYLAPAGTVGSVTIGEYFYSSTYDAAEDPVSCSSSTISLTGGTIAQGYRALY